MLVGTSVVYQLIVQIQTLAASPLTYSVSVEFVNLLYLLTVGWAQITDITVDLPPDVTVLPQTYTLHAIKSGYTQNYLRSATWYYESGSTSTELTTSLCNGQYGYSCTIGNGVLLHSSNGTYDYTLTVTWNGEIITSGVLSQSKNNGDHVYRFYLFFGLDCCDPVSRNRIKTVNGMCIHKEYIYNFLILVPGSAPSTLTVVNKTATTITVNWTALDSSDADGYVVNVTSDTDTVHTVQVEGSSNNTITLNGLRVETTYNLTVRAYQQLLGPASNTISVQTLPGIATAPVNVTLLVYF